MEYAVAFILSMTYPHQNHACPVDWTTSIPSSILQAIQTFQNKTTTGIPVWYMECNVLHCTILPHWQPKMLNHSLSSGATLKLIEKILDLEYIDMAKLISDYWNMEEGVQSQSS